MWLKSVLFMVPGYGSPASPRLRRRGGIVPAVRLLDCDPRGAMSNGPPRLVGLVDVPDHESAAAQHIGVRADGLAVLHQEVLSGRIASSSAHPSSRDSKSVK